MIRLTNRRCFIKGLLAGGCWAGFPSSVRAAFLKGSLLNTCGSALPIHLAEHPFVTAAWKDIDPMQFWDSHVHVAGSGDSGSGIMTSREMSSVLHPVQFAQHEFYLNAACANKDDVDRSYVARLKHLVNELQPGCKLQLFAFEQVHDETGKAIPENSAFYVPNHYVRDIVSKSPEYFEWACSIHPYRPDAVDALETAIAEGARAVKWLPPAMGIDPGSSKCDAFYAALGRLGVPVICHAGEEKAVEGAGLSEAGNPLRLRRALDAGVRVVVAHCASIGEDIDLDRGEHGPRVPSFELFSRMMEKKEYREHLYADISAVVLRNHSTDTLREIIEHQDWHDRLLNGSDYPLPGVLPLVSPGSLARAGLLDRDIAPVLNEIQNYNPLLFDFVLKRHLRSGKQKLPESIFHTRDFFTRGVT